MPAVLYYVHDPMCSWCWGFRPTWLALQDQLPEGVRVQRLLGGLAPDRGALIDGGRQGETRHDKHPEARGSHGEESFCGMSSSLSQV